MDESKLKEAFMKIKEEMFTLLNEISSVKVGLEETNNFIKHLDEEIIKLKLDLLLKDSEKPLRNTPSGSIIHQLDTPTHNPTDISKNPSVTANPTHNPTVPQEIGGWNTRNLESSTGNDGVPTDRQTNRQTIQQTPFTPEIPSLDTTNSLSLNYSPPQVVTNISKPIKQQIVEASEILDSLDTIKKEIRRKFKSITRQEMLVFSTIYAFESQNLDVNYKNVALKLSLSESSIRDYVQRIIKKGIPLEKEKLNNKKILLHISPELKKIAPLDTIIKLRNL